MIARLPLFSLAGLALASAALAQDNAPQEFEARLVGHAVLPAETTIEAPEGAPEGFAKSGRFTAGEERQAVRVEQLGTIPTKNTDKTLPIEGQPVQGFSGIRSLGQDRFLVLTDNGFGSKMNSTDALLMFHEVAVDWDAGEVARERTVFWSDPDHVIPFAIVNEFTDHRFLTGADLDPESLQPTGETYWVGEEFGPYLLELDQEGRVQRFEETVTGGATVRSPDHFQLRTPGAPEEMDLSFDLPRSRGYEGMALSSDGTTLYPLLEGRLHRDGAYEEVGGRGVLRLLAFDLEGGWSDHVRYYPLEDSEHAIGDFNMIDERRGLVIERGWNEGDPRIEGFEEPAEFKRVYLIDIEDTSEEGVVRKLGYIDLLNIQDPDGVALDGTMEGVFTFPFVTIEDVDRVDETRIVVANDNNYPFSSGRTPGKADNNEFILLEVGEFLSAGS